MEARSKRVPKKSAKLLSYEQESKDFNKKPHKKKAEKIESKPPPTVPKLKIKLSSRNPPEPAPATTPKVPKLKVKIEPKSRKRKQNEAEPEEKPIKTPKAKKQKTALAEVKREPLLPTDIEVDAEDVGSLTNSTPTPGDSLSQVAERGYTEESQAGTADSQARSNKRQRKLPAKLAEEENEADSDMHSNKAAKFFETKKAEQKAASALAKQDASKADKKKKRKRMPTAYTMWCNSYRAKLQAQFPGMGFVATNQKLGEVWWSIPLKEKNIWKRKAKRLATHGAPKTSAKTGESMKYIGAKTGAPGKRNNPSAPGTSLAVQGVKSEPVPKLANMNPVYKVTQTEPVDIAAYMKVMAETLSTIGTGLAKRGDAKVQGSLEMLLDSFLSGASSLMALTQQVPELDGDIDPETHRQRMANVAYFIPNI